MCTYTTFFEKYCVSWKILKYIIDLNLPSFLCVYKELHAMISKWKVAQGQNWPSSEKSHFGEKTQYLMNSMYYGSNFAIYVISDISELKMSLTFILFTIRFKELL